jgi:DUF1009 family protein
MSRIGLIAGNGRFPIIFAENARRLGYTVSAVAHIGETAPELEQVVERIHWVKIGQFNKLIDALKEDGVRQAVMLGGIKKTHVFAVRPDLRALAVVSRLRELKDDAILRAVAAELESEGIRIRESTFGLRGILVEEGPLTKRRPDKREWEDIRFGWRMAEEIGRLDIGQCIVVKDRMVVAVEAVEGTDAAIRRGGELSREGAVVIKRSKPQQDLRFDLPAVGPKTIDVMQGVKATVLALEAGRTVLLDRDDMLERAAQAGIAILGMTADAAGDES